MLNFTPSSLEQDLILQHTGRIGWQLVTHVYIERKKVLYLYELCICTGNHPPPPSLLTDIQMHKHQTV